MEDFKSKAKDHEDFGSDGERSMSCQIFAVRDERANMEYEVPGFIPCKIKEKALSNDLNFRIPLTGPYSVNLRAFLYHGLALTGEYYMGLPASFSSLRYGLHYHLITI